MMVEPAGPAAPVQIAGGQVLPTSASVQCQRGVKRLARDCVTAPVPFNVTESRKLCLASTRFAAPLNAPIVPLNTGVGAACCVGGTGGAVSEVSGGAGRQRWKRLRSRSTGTGHRPTRFATLL